MKSAMRSPLKAKSLRYPGQSVDERRYELLYDKLLTPLIIVMMLFCMTGLEWWCIYHPSAHSRWIYSVFSMIGIGYFGGQFWRLWPQLRQLRLASEGEKVVGQYLEQLLAHPT